MAKVHRSSKGVWLEDEVHGWRQTLGASGLVVSLLTSDEEAHLELQREREACTENGLEYISFPIVDRSVPKSDQDAVRLIETIDSLLRERKNVLVHCRQGLGRSGVIASGVLIKNGVPAAEAMKRWTSVRGAQVPETLQQCIWLDDLPAQLSRTAVRT